MTAGPSQQKAQGGPGLRELPPSISWLHLASLSPSSEHKQHCCNLALCKFTVSYVTLYCFPNFSFSISDLSVLIWHLASPLAHIPRLFMVPKDDGWKNNVGAGQQAEKYSDMWVPNHSQRVWSWRVRARAVTPGNHGVWQPHWGLCRHGLLGAHCTAFQPEVLPKHFLHKPSLTSVCQTNVAKEPEDLRVH